MARTVPAACLFMILIVGSGLRVWAADGDLWIDEVWSLNQMRVAASSAGWNDWIAVFFHANTHPLNTLYMRFIDGWPALIGSPMAYRALSIVSGICSIALVGWWGWRRNPATAIIITSLFAFSYPMINYAAEARGYGVLILATLAASNALKSYLDAPNAKMIILFVTFSLLGLLSHPTFVVVQAGLGFSALAALYSARRNVVSTLAKLVRLFGLQLIAISVFGAVAVNNMIRGGGCCPEPALESIRIMADWTFGLDANEIISVVPLIVLSISLIVIIVNMMRGKNHMWITLTIVVVIFPLITLIIEDKPNVIHRYYLISAVYALLMIGLGLSYLWQKGGWRRAVCTVFLALFCVGNTDLLFKFSQGGRGQYSRVIEIIARSSTGIQRISGFHNFSVGTLVRHHVHLKELDGRLQFVDRKDESQNPPAWFINGYLDGKAPTSQITRGQTAYHLIKTYPQWGLSGDTWALYKRSATEDG